MIKEKCEPHVACEKIEEGQKLQVTDPRTYCFNIANKSGDVCLPKSCPIVKKGEERRTIKDEETESTVEYEKLISLKQPQTTCIPPKATDGHFVKAVGQSKQTGNEESKIHEDTITNDEEKIIFEIPNIEENNSEGRVDKRRQERIGAGGKGRPKNTGVKSSPQGKAGPKDVVDKVSSKSGGATIIPQGKVSSLGTVESNRDAASDGKDKPTNKQVNTEAESLARLLGIAKGPAAIMASFGDSETAKESLASIGAMSMGGAFECECCECDPCVCGPRGLNIENIVAALKTMTRSGEDLEKLIAALGPGAMAALDTIMAKEGETAAKWATGGGTSEDHWRAEDKRLDVPTVVSSTPVETHSHKALGEAWLRGDFDEMDSCHCLPGICPCPGDHYLFKKNIDKEMDKKKKKKRIRKKVKKIGKDGKEYEEWDWVTPSESDGVSRLSETCVCPPTKHFLTPASSETAVSGRFVDGNKRIHWGELMVCACPRLQRTLVIIKPECVKFKDVVLRAVKSYGLDILAERQFQLSPEEASEIYSKYYGSVRFPNMVVSISQAPVLVLSMGGIDVVRIWNHIIGPDGTLPSEWFLPDWISRKFGYYGEIVDALHGSKDLTSAERENRYFFPGSVIDPLMKSETDVKDYIAKNVNPTLLKGLTLLAKQKPIDPIIFLAEWILTHNPFQPHFPMSISLAPV